MLFAPGASREHYFEGLAQFGELSDNERREWFVKNDNFFVESTYFAGHAVGTARHRVRAGPSRPERQIGCGLDKPGSGKTTFALRIAAELLAQGTIERVTVVVPNRTPQGPVGGHGKSS